MKPHLVIATQNKLTRTELQHAIDAQHFLVRLILLAPMLGSGSKMTGRLDGTDVSFLFEERPADERSLSRGLRYLFATPGSGDMLACAAGGIVALSYMAAASGEICLDDGSRTSDPGQLKQMLDAMLAVGLDKMTAYQARYPDEFAKPAEAGPSYLVANRV
jgi:hypothetical protein